MKIYIVRNHTKSRILGAFDNEDAAKSMQSKFADSTVTEIELQHEDTHECLVALILSQRIYKTYSYGFVTKVVQLACPTETKYDVGMWMLNLDNNTGEYSLSPEIYAYMTREKAESYSNEQLETLFNRTLQKANNIWQRKSWNWSSKKAKQLREEIMNQIIEELTQFFE